MKYLLTLIIILFIFVPYVEAAKLYAIIEMEGGWPKLEGLPYQGFVLCDQKGGYGAYLITGTKEQLAAISALKGVTSVGATKEYVEVKDEKGTVTAKELSNPTLSKAEVEKINAVSIGTAKPVIKEDMKVDEAVTTLFKMFNDKFVMGSIDVADAEDTPVVIKPVEPKDDEKPVIPIDDGKEVVK
jgi:hypothetical protein